MAHHVTEVFRVTVPSVGLVLRARADIDGKQAAYQKRIAEGVLVGSLDFINEPGTFRLDLRITFDDSTERIVRLEFMVVSVKMNVAHDYGEIVKTIDREKPNIVRAFLSKTLLWELEDEWPRRDGLA